MRFLGIAAIAAAVACSRTGDSESVETSIAGGDTGGATTTSTTSAGAGGGDGGDGGALACMPADAFVGWDGCYRPDPLCCSDLYCINVAARCEVETDGLAEPYLCANVPPTMNGGLTDFRSCHQLPGEVDIDCMWGPSAILCCEPQ